MNSSHLYRMALRVLIGAVGLSAVLGIIALLQRDLDGSSGKTLATTLVVSAASLLIMANAAGLEKRSVGYLLISGAGLLTALGALPVFLYAIWLDADDELWRSVASLEVISVFAGHSSLLSLRQLSAQYRWLKPIATVLGGALAALVIWMIGSDDFFGGGKLRLAGVLSILLLSVTIVIPILSRLVAFDDPERAGGEAGRQRSVGVRYCPNCGRAMTASGEKGRCGECGAGFAVKFDAKN